MGDRVGLGWRGPLAAEILAHLDEIDVLEVIAEQVWHGGAPLIEAVANLARRVPLHVHSTILGPASVSPVPPGLLDRLAELIDRVQPAGWSEHLAFMRAGGIELGHLGAPPRTPETLEGTLRNVERAARIVGAPPQLENVASLIDAPGSTIDEGSWLRAVTEASGCRLLLDLHNLHANTRNFGGDAEAVIAHLDLGRVGTIHLAGGRWIESPDGRPRILDDHRHAVPEPVFDLLRAIAERAEGPLTVVLERDGDYPPFEVLLDELRRARAAIAFGRQRRGDLQGRRI